MSEEITKLKHAEQSNTQAQVCGLQLASNHFYHDISKHLKKQQFNRTLKQNLAIQNFSAAVYCAGLFLHLAEQQRRDELCPGATSLPKGGWKSLQMVLNPLLLTRWRMFFTTSLAA